MPFIAVMVVRDSFSDAIKVVGNHNGYNLQANLAALAAHYGMHCSGWIKQARPTPCNGRLLLQTGWFRWNGQNRSTLYICVYDIMVKSLIARFMGPTWGLPGANRTQLGPMLATWTLLSGIVPVHTYLQISASTPENSKFQLLYSMHILNL